MKWWMEADKRSYCSSQVNFEMMLLYPHAKHFLVSFQINCAVRGYWGELRTPVGVFKMHFSIGLGSMKVAKWILNHFITRESHFLHLQHLKKMAWCRSVPSKLNRRINPFAVSFFFFFFFLILEPLSGRKSHFLHSSSRRDERVRHLNK